MFNIVDRAKQTITEYVFLRKDETHSKQNDIIVLAYIKQCSFREDLKCVIYIKL